MSVSSRVLTGWSEIDLSSTNVANQVAGYDFITNKAWLLGGRCAAGNCDNDAMSYNLDAISSSGTHDTLSSSFRTYSQSYVTINRTIYFAQSGKIYTYDMETGSINTNFATSSSPDDPCMATDGRYLFITGGGGRSMSDLYTIFH